MPTSLGGSPDTVWTLLLVPVITRMGRVPRWRSWRWDFPAAPSRRGFLLPLDDDLLETVARCGLIIPRRNTSTLICGSLAEGRAARTGGGYIKITNLVEATLAVAYDSATVWVDADGCVTIKLLAQNDRFVRILDTGTTCALRIGT